MCGLDRDEVSKGPALRRAVADGRRCGLNPLPACLIPAPLPPLAFLNLRRARDLRIGDVVVLRHDLTTDLIDVEALPCGLVRLRYSVDDTDAVVVPGSTALMVFA